MEKKEKYLSPQCESYYVHLNEIIAASVDPQIVFFKDEDEW